MIEYKTKVKINTIENAKHFVETMKELQSNVDVCQGRYTVNAKSILGIFSLNLTQEMKVVLFDEYGEGRQFFEKVNKYLT